MNEIVFGEKMSRFRAKGKKVVELFNERTGTVIRTITFYSQKEFDEFIKSFKEMKYPGYGWRHIDKRRKKGNNNLIEHYHKS